MVTPLLLENINNQMEPIIMRLFHITLICLVEDGLEKTKREEDRSHNTTNEPSNYQSGANNQDKEETTEIKELQRPHN